MGADTFEAREGWVPANTEGSVWCYRARGNAGVLAFRRSEGGEPLYEATHQDCYALDETITTSCRADAVRFAISGAELPAPAPDDAPLVAAEPPAAPAAPSPALGGEREAIREAWDRYIDAASGLLTHVKARLDSGSQGELLGSVDQALALVRQGALGTSAAGADPVDVLSVTVGAVLRKAHELILAEAVDGLTR